MNDIIPKGLFVSCQAYEGEPLFGATIMAAMARAALQGGAVGIRANGPADIAAIRAVTDRPIIGLYKQHWPGVPVYITPTRETAVAIVSAGCDLVALDATPRARPNAEQLAGLVAYVQDTLKCPVMADVSCLADASLAESLGVACVSTTLAGYTEHGRPAMSEPDLEFLGELVAVSRVPVVAEGRFRTPEQVRAAFELGAQAVVVGTAITRPWEVTRWFVDAIP